MLLCLLAASTFWLLNALNKSYTTRISYPIQFNYDSDTLVPIRPLPEEVVVNVTGQGWRLLRKSMRIDVRPVELTLRNLPAATYLTGSSLRPSLSNLLDGLELNFIATDTLFFRFDYLVERTIPVAVDTTLVEAGDNHVLVPPVEITPDSITFRGPASMVDSLPEPFVVYPPAHQITTPFQTTLPIEFDNKEMVQASASEVQVQFDVAPLVQEERQIEPGLVNFPLNQSFVMRPATATLRYSFIQGTGKNIDRDLFVLVLDYARYNPQDSTIVPTLIQQPPHLRSLSIAPEKFKVFFQED